MNIMVVVDLNLESIALHNHGKLINAKINVILASLITSKLVK